MFFFSSREHNGCMYRDGIEYCFRFPVAFLLSCHRDPQDIRAIVRLRLTGQTKK